MGYWWALTHSKKSSQIVFAIALQSYVDFLAESLRARSSLEGASIAKEIGNYRCEKIWFWRQRIHAGLSASPPVGTVRERLIRFCKGGDGESKTCSLRSSSWNLVTANGVFPVKNWILFVWLTTKKALKKIVLRMCFWLGRAFQKKKKLYTNVPFRPR